MHGYIFQVLWRMYLLFPLLRPSLLSISDITWQTWVLCTNILHEPK